MTTKKSYDPAAIEQAVLEHEHNLKVAPPRETVGASEFFILKGSSFKYKEFTQGACHGFISYVKVPDNFAALTCVVSSKVENLPQKVLEAYYHYLLNDSPLADAFLSKNAKLCLQKCRVFMAAHRVPSNVLMCALQSLRRAWEGPKTIQTWYNLVKNGVFPDVAFVAKDVFNVEANSNGDYTVFVRAVATAHNFVPASDLSKKWFNNFLASKVKKPNPTWYFSGSTSYRSPYNVVEAYGNTFNGNSQFPSTMDILQSAFSEFGLERKNDEKTNPFYKAAKRILEKEKAPGQQARIIEDHQLANMIQTVMVDNLP